MYGPFADACNNALNELSRLQVEGLPHFSDRIVFVRVEQSVQSQHSARKNWPRPDIVLMSWELFNLSKESPYFTLDEQDIFIDKSDTELLWSEIRSTVEIEFMGSPKHDGWKTFDMEFGTLIESEAYTSLTVNDDCDEPQFIEENLPNYHYCKCMPLGTLLLLIYFIRLSRAFRRSCCRGRTPHGRKPRNSGQPGLECSNAK